MFEQDIDESFGKDGSNIDQKFTANFRMGERNQAFVDPDLSEKTRILPRESFAAALQITQNSVKLLFVEIAKRVGRPNDSECFIALNWLQRCHADDMLGHDIVGLIE